MIWSAARSRSSTRGGTNFRDITSHIGTFFRDGPVITQLNQHDVEEPFMSVKGHTIHFATLIESFQTAYSQRDDVVMGASTIALARQHQYRSYLRRRDDYRGAAFVGIVAGNEALAENKFGAHQRHFRSAAADLRRAGQDMLALQIDTSIKDFYGAPRLRPVRPQKRPMDSRALQAMKAAFGVWEDDFWKIVPVYAGVKPVSMVNMPPSAVPILERYNLLVLPLSESGQVLTSGENIQEPKSTLTLRFSDSSGQLLRLEQVGAGAGVVNINVPEGEVMDVVLPPDNALVYSHQSVQAAIGHYQALLRGTLLSESDHRDVLAKVFHSDSGESPQEDLSGLFFGYDPMTLGCYSSLKDAPFLASVIIGNFLEAFSCTIRNLKNGRLIAKRVAWTVEQAKYALQLSEQVKVYVGSINNPSGIHKEWIPWLLNQGVFPADLS